MILGGINRTTGQPSVDVEVWLPHLHRRKEIRMLVDTVSDQTTVSFADMDLETQPDPPPDDAAQVAVAGGRFVPGRSAVAMITLTQTEGSAWSIPTEIVLLSGPAGNARLGLDVLRHMLIVIDPEEAEVRMQPTA